MIISHQYKFIFIKTKKTAGTSIEVYLSPFCGETDILTPINPHVEPHIARNYKGLWNPLPEIMAPQGRGLVKTLKKMRQQKKFYNHIPAWTVKNRISHQCWHDYFKFCVERNPWDKTLSHYHMINARAGGDLSLDQYFNAADFCLNYPQYTDVNGEVLVDRVIKYESLADELGPIFDQLGIPFNGTLGVSAKSDHRPEKRPYREVFTAEQSAIIAAVFAKEIDLHGYRY